MFCRGKVRKFLLVSAALLAIRTETTFADIIRWDNQQVILGTEGITLTADVDLSGWNRPSYQLEFGSPSPRSTKIVITSGRFSV